MLSAPTKTNMLDECGDHAVLFKSVSETENENNDVYSSEFRSANFQVTLIPVLDFEFINLSELLKKLKNPNDYEGIIFTSPRCVTAVELSAGNGNDKSVLEKWQSHTHYVVGEKTGQMIEKFNFVANGKKSGNAKNLAEIISRGHYSKPFLYPKGSLTKDIFKIMLQNNNIKVDDTLVYQTKPHVELEANIEKLKSICYEKAFYFIYFSPSGVNFTLPLLQKHQFDLNKIKFVAIGPTTEGALKENGLNIVAIADKPEPKALLNAVLAQKKDGI